MFAEECFRQRLVTVGKAGPCSAVHPTANADKSDFGSVLTWVRVIRETRLLPGLPHPPCAEAPLRRVSTIHQRPRVPFLEARLQLQRSQLRIGPTYELRTALVNYNAIGTPGITFLDFQHIQINTLIPSHKNGFPCSSSSSPLPGCGPAHGHRHLHPRPWRHRPWLGLGRRAMAPPPTP